MRVKCVDHVLAQYRVPFHEGVRARLAASGVQYDAIFGQPDSAMAMKGDVASLGWERKVTNNYIRVGPFSAVWQPVLKDIWNCDLAIVGQENRLLVNYVAQMLAPFRPSRLAFWGHGRNFQSRHPQGMAERWKRWWAPRCDWWFAYTEETRRHIEALGFPPERITVVHNAVDTRDMQRFAENVTPERLVQRRRELGLSGGNVGVYVGGIYDDKRFPFLIEAADRVRMYIPDFELVIVGGGPEYKSLQAMAAERPWIKLTGPRFGQEKVELMRLGRLFLIPGLVGLAILDAAAIGLPVVTTAFPYHSPEIAYLQDGVNGVIVPDWESIDAYAEVVVTLLSEPDRIQAMSVQARAIAEQYTIENMARNFAEGVMAALAAPKQR